MLERRRDGDSNISATMKPIPFPEPKNAIGIGLGFSISRKEFPVSGRMSETGSRLGFKVTLESDLPNARVPEI
jgi:hypothetical protein